MLPCGAGIFVRNFIVTHRLFGRASWRNSGWLPIMSLGYRTIYQMWAYRYVVHSRRVVGTMERRRRLANMTNCQFDVHDSPFVYFLARSNFHVLTKATETLRHSGKFNCHSRTHSVTFLLSSCSFSLLILINFCLERMSMIIFIVSYVTFL